MSYIHERKGILNFVLLGAKSTGKTCYLKHLAKRKEINAIDEVTIDYLDQIQNETQGTSISYTELFFNYKNKDFNIEFQIDDYDGNFVETWHNSSINKEYKDKLTEYVKESEGVFIFLPYEDKHDIEKFERMENEIGIFINTIKEEYGEDHNLLPIPIIFAVSKWDESSDNIYTEKEIEKAKEYIKSNQTLHLIQEKVMQHFESYEVMPLSSTKDFKMLDPIQYALEITFQRWERTISQLLEQNNKEELLIYLKEKLYDIKSYKDSKYKKLYEELESEIASQYLNQIETIENLVDFEAYIEENKHILNAFSDTNQDTIESKREELQSKVKRKKIIISFLATIILGVSIYGYSIYGTTQKEEKLFKNIMIEYQHDNLVKTLNNIEQYYKIFNNSQNKKHYNKLKFIEEDIKLKIREGIKEDFYNFKSMSSLLKAWNSINKIKNNMTAFKISEEFKDVIAEFSKLQLLQSNYTTALNAIDGLSLETISKDNLNEIFILLNSFAEYDESQAVQEKLKKKFQTVKTLILDTTDINEDDLNNLIEVASTMNISEEDIQMLNNKLAQVKIENIFKEFIENLNNEDNLQDAIIYIENHRDYKNFDKNKMQRARQLINQKLNQKVKGILEDIPEKIKNIDNFDKLNDKLKTIYKYRDAIIKLPFDDKTPFTIEIQTQVAEKENLFKIYRNILINGISTSKLILKAQKKNKLNITKSDDEIKIYLNNKYICGANDGFDGSSVTYSSYQKYVTGIYNIKIEEIDTGMPDDSMPVNFTITKNNLISFYNTGVLSYAWSNWGITIELRK